MDPDVHGIDMFSSGMSKKTIRKHQAQYKFIELFLSCLPVNCTFEYMFLSKYSYEF